MRRRSAFCGTRARQRVVVGTLDRDQIGPETTEVCAFLQKRALADTGSDRHRVRQLHLRVEFDGGVCRGSQQDTWLSKHKGDTVECLENMRGTPSGTCCSFACKAQLREPELSTVSRTPRYLRVPTPRASSGTRARERERDPRESPLGTFESTRAERTERGRERVGLFVLLPTQSRSISNSNSKSFSNLNSNSLSLWCGALDLVLSSFQTHSRVFWRRSLEWNTIQSVVESLSRPRTSKKSRSKSRLRRAVSRELAARVADERVLARLPLSSLEFPVSNVNT